jgi:energy-coupling factor transporter transmembrane protein EcfT
LLAMRLALRRLRMMYTLTPVVIWVVITLISLLLPNHARPGIIALGLIPLLALVCFVTWKIWTRRIEEVEDRMQLFNE